MSSQLTFYIVVIKTYQLTEDSHSSGFKHETFFSVSGFHYHTEWKWIQLVIDTVSFTESHFAFICGSPVQHKTMLVKPSCASRYLLQSRSDLHPFPRILHVKQ